MKQAQQRCASSESVCSECSEDSEETPPFSPEKQKNIFGKVEKQTDFINCIISGDQGFSVEYAWKFCGMAAKGLPVCTGSLTWQGTAEIVLAQTEWVIQNQMYMRGQRKVKHHGNLLSDSIEV